MLSKCIEQAVAERRRHLNDVKGRVIETEIRLGVRADESGRRTKDETACRWFASNIGETHFFATFHILASHAGVEISEKSTSTHHRFASEVAPSAVRCEIDGGGERWTHKHVLSQHDFTHDSWFDVRVAVAEETRVAAPPGILEARQMATRVHNAWEQQRTRLSLPVHTRRRVRRSLRFVWAPAWRVDFTEVQSSQRIEAFHNSATVTEHAFVNQEDTREIELELIADNDDDEGDAELAHQATRLLTELATALGATPAEARRRVDNDRRIAEMRTMLTSI